MERRLFALMTLAGALAVLLGLALLALEPAWLSHGWLKLKLVLVAGLIAYHLACGRLLARLRDGRNRYGSRWYRWFNEIPTLLLFAIVILAVVKTG